MKKFSFFEKLSGVGRSEDSFDAFDDEVTGSPSHATKQIKTISPRAAGAAQAHAADSAGAGQLPVDLYQTGNEFVIRAFVAGVRADALSISISRDMVQIEGSRLETEQIPEVDYFTRELFWGSFQRLIQLPEEVDVENSSATAKDGLLVLILPKLDRARQMKLRVKAG